jgi:hypothetical protein
LRRSVTLIASWAKLFQIIHDAHKRLSPYTVPEIAL